MKGREAKRQIKKRGALITFSGDEISEAEEGDGRDGEMRGGGGREGNEV